MNRMALFKKCFVLVLALSLMLTSLEGCFGENTAGGTFSIRYDLGNTADHFVNNPSEAKAGDVVEIKTKEVLYDADIHVYVDGQEISKSHYDSDYWGYSFVMPEKDVLITAKFYTKDEIWGTGDSVVWATNMSFKKTESVSQTMRTGSFDERLLAYLSKRTDGNYMASPLSFRYALGLLLAGAAGETKTELLNAFGVSSEEEWIQYCLDFNGFVEYFADGLEQDVKRHQEQVSQGWISENTPEPFRALRVANSVWKAERITEEFTAAYKESVEKNYAAEYRAFNAANAAKLINEWADVKTEHMIQRLLPDDYDTESLAVVLMNALYFKDTWKNEFYKGATKEREFHARNGQTTKKDFMNNTDRFSYYEDDDSKLVILPMTGGVSMAFVLGSTEDLSEKISKADVKNVNVTIPKMDLETEFSNGEFVDFLKACGVEQAFDPDNADFSAMLDHQVYVSDIIQKTRIKLDEEGVEAAAVTAIMVNDTAFIEPEEPKEFTADRPFSFYIYTTCNDTTAILFAGEIVE